MILQTSLVFAIEARFHLTEVSVFMFATIDLLIDVSLFLFTIICLAGLIMRQVGNARWGKHIQNTKTLKHIQDAKTLTIPDTKTIKHIQDAKTIKPQQNDWRDSRRPDDLRDVPKLYNLREARYVLLEAQYGTVINHNGEISRMAFECLIKSGYILNISKGTIYVFDGLKLKIKMYSDELEVASMSEPATPRDDKENWLPISEDVKDKDIQERVEQMLNRLIILLRKTEQDMKNEDDIKLSAQKAAILKSAERNYNTSPVAALEAPSVITNVMSLTEKDALGIRLSSEN
jgi:hypothetical protein